MRERLKALIAQMRWSGMAAVLDEELDRAERQGTPLPEVLVRLFSAEDAARREKSLAYRLSQAHLPWPWTLQSFPFARQPSVNKAQVLTLAGLDFLRRGENLLLIGPPGTGKSGIAIGLLREACLNGYRARFYNAQALLDELYASLADRSTVGLLNQLCRLPLIVIDELGYLNLKPEQVNGKRSAHPPLCAHDHAGFLRGNSSSMRRFGQAGSFAKVSVSQAMGSIPFARAVSSSD